MARRQFVGNRCENARVLSLSLPRRRARGLLQDFCYYHNLQIAGIEHSGDNRTGAGDGDDETIRIKLNELPAHVASFVVVISCFQVRRTRAPPSSRWRVPQPPSLPPPPLLVDSPPRAMRSRALLMLAHDMHRTPTTLVV